MSVLARRSFYFLVTLLDTESVKFPQSFCITTKLKKIDTHKLQMLIILNEATSLQMGKACKIDLPPYPAIQTSFDNFSTESENTVFTRISAAALIKFFAPLVRRLIEGGAYLKTGRYKEIFSFYLMAYFSSVRKYYSM